MGAGDRGAGTMLERLAGRAGIRSREQKWRLYQSLFPPRPGEKVLDVGASDLVDIPWENWFLKRYPYPEQVTAVVLEGGAKLRETFPRITVVEADGRELPFSDDAFDVVHSNAVVEHVGPWPEQRRFVTELVRVGRRGFITTPNRWFPIESHCRLPLVHWLPRPLAWDLQRRLGRPGAEAWLLGPRRFMRLVKDAGAASVRLHRQRMAGLTATLVVTYR